MFQTLETILDWAREERHLKRLLCSEDRYGRTGILLAAYGGYVECMKILIERVLINSAVYSDIYICLCT